MKQFFLLILFFWLLPAMASEVWFNRPIDFNHYKDIQSWEQELFLNFPTPANLSYSDKIALSMNCKEVMANDSAVYTNWDGSSQADHNNALLIDYQCHLIDIFRHLKPSKVSYLGNYTFSMDSFDELPACFTGAMEDSDVAMTQEAVLSGTSWNSYVKSFPVITVAPYKITARYIHSTNQTLILTLDLI